MVEVIAQQSVNTRDLPELALIKNGSDGLTLANEPGFALFKFGDIEIDLLSTVAGFTGDIDVINGPYVFSGTIRQVDVRGAGDAPLYSITGSSFQIQALYADAFDNGKLDTLPSVIFSGNDTLEGSNFADTLFAFGSDDFIEGNDGNDELNGGANHDELTGGRDADELTGGADSDTFIFLALADSTKKASGRDTILDFTNGDEIDLSAIDAKKGDGKANSKFIFIKKADFHDEKGELRYKVKNGDAFVQGDVNGDGKADFALLVDGVSKLKAVDFEL